MRFTLAGLLIVLTQTTLSSESAAPKKDAKKKDPTCCLECMYPLVHSEFAKVKIFHTPWSSNFTGFCKNVFNRDGSCCDTESLKDYSDEWIDSIEDKMNKTLTALPNFRTALTSAAELRKFMKAKKKDILKAKKIISKAQYEDFEKHVLTALSEGVFMFYRKEEKVQLSAKQCFATLANLRKNALCMRCSGKASQFWDSKKKNYLVKKSTCHNVIDSCVEPFAYFSEAMTFMRRLGQFREALKGEDVRTTQAKGMLRADYNFFKACSLDKEYCKGNKKMYEKVCSFVTLGEVNPDIEGERATLVDGELVARRISLGLDPAKDTVFRVLGDAPKPAPSWWGFMKVDEDKGADLLYGFVSTSLTINGFNNNRIPGLVTSEEEAAKTLFGKPLGKTNLEIKFGSVYSKIAVLFSLTLIIFA